MAPAERDDLTRISGIGPVMQNLLNDLGVVSFAQLAAFDESDVAQVDEALDEFPGRIVRDDWVGQARGLVGQGAGTGGAPADTGRGKRQPLFVAPTERDDLKEISGIGPAMENLLNELGVVSFAQLASFDQADIEQVDAALEDFPGRLERDDWVGQARGLLNQGGASTTASAALSGARETTAQKSSPGGAPAMGTATAGQSAAVGVAGSGSSGSGAGRGEADDLTRINGIGKATQKRLVGFNVTTYADVAGLDAQTIEQIESALDDGPGRIERDDWIAQAKALGSS